MPQVFPLEQRHQQHVNVDSYSGQAALERDEIIVPELSVGHRTDAEALIAGSDHIFGLGHYVQDLINAADDGNGHHQESVKQTEDAMNCTAAAIQLHLDAHESHPNRHGLYAFLHRRCEHPARSVNPLALAHPPLTCPLNLTSETIDRDLTCLLTTSLAVVTCSLFHWLDICSIQRNMHNTEHTKQS